MILDARPYVNGFELIDPLKFNNHSPDETIESLLVVTRE